MNPILKQSFHWWVWKTFGKYTSQPQWNQTIKPGNRRWDRICFFNGFNFQLSRGLTNPKMRSVVIASGDDSSKTKTAWHAEFTHSSQLSFPKISLRSPRKVHSAKVIWCLKCPCLDTTTHLQWTNQQRALLADVGTLMHQRLSSCRVARCFYTIS